MALYRLKKRDSRRGSQCSVSIYSNGTLAVNSVAIREYRLKEGRIALFGDHVIEDKVAFQYVEGVEVDGADVCTFKAQKDKEGKLAAYQASAGAFLIDHPLYEAGETMSYPLYYDPEEGAYYFLLGNGKVTGRKKKSKVSNEVKEVPGASAASPESDNGVAEDVGAEEGTA